MTKRKPLIERESHLNREYSIEVDGWTIEKGDLIKIVGEYGVKFKFDSFVTNTRTGSQWVDCYEMQRGITGSYRSFTLDRVRRIPRKRSSGIVRRRKSS